LVDIILWKNSKKNGIDIIKEIRGKSKKIPIVTVSWLDDISRLEKSFREWANDYIVKPFRLKELELRVCRWFESYFFTDISGKNKIRYEWLEYDIKNNDFYYNKTQLHLTKGCKYLLSIFLTHPEVLLSEENLREKIWWDLTQTVERNLRVNVMRLKTSLKPFWIDHWIQNIRWEWYRIKK
jgi:DNA-binding response OmpR family regulator